MRVLSKIVCGFKRDGSVLLKKGENVLDEPLTSTERAFIEAMKTAGVVTVMADHVPAAPISETKMKVATSTRVDVPKKKAMRTRRAVK